MRLRPLDLDGRVRLVWKAATWLERGKADPALSLLETLAGEDLDAWSASVVRGTRRLREALAHIARASALDREGEPEAASYHWTQAARACMAAASGGVSLELTHRTGSMVLALPDPWLQVIDAFQEHLDGEHRRSAATAPAVAPPARAARGAR